MIRNPTKLTVLLGQRLKNLRLEKGWKQSNLSERSGVALATLQRMENSGKGTVESMLKMAFALGRIEEFEEVLMPPKPSSLEEIEQRQTKSPKRGRT